MGRENVEAGDRVALQWGMGILEGETDLHCNGVGEHWSRRPSGIARVSQRETDLCCNGAGERWSRRLSCIAMGDGNTGRGD